MIHMKNGRGSGSYEASRSAPVEQSLEEIQKLESKAEQWIRHNPVLGVSLALAVGVGVGLLIKRRLL